MNGNRDNQFSSTPDSEGASMGPSDPFVEKSGKGRKMTVRIVAVCIVVMLAFLVYSLLTFTVKPDGLVLAIDDLKSEPWQLAYSPDGRYLAYCADSKGERTDSSVFLHDARTGGFVRGFAPGGTPVLEWMFSGDGSVLAASCRTGLRLWRVADGRELARLNMTDIVYEQGLALSRDAGWFAIRALDGETVAVWKSSPLTLVGTITRHPWMTFRTYGFNRENEFVLVFTTEPKDGNLPDTLWTVRYVDGIPARGFKTVLGKESTQPGFIALSPDASYLAYLDGSLLTVLDCRTGEELLEIPDAARDGANCCRFFPNPPSLVMLEGSYRLKRFMLPDGAGAGEALSHHMLTEPTRVSFGVGPRYFVVQEHDRDVLRSFPGADLIRELSQRDAVLQWSTQIRSVAFSPDGKQLATGRKGIRIWSLP
jgi:WD40 repeat protein